jgi:RNA polymerase sigma-70 factor (ECF subfamily)
MAGAMGVLRRLQVRPGRDADDARSDDGDSDDELAESMRAAGRGDQLAFAAVYDATAPRVHGIVLRVVRDPAQSEEVVQEVFVELWRLAPRFDGRRGSAAAWIATIAHRRAVDRVRSEQASRDRAERDAAQAERATDMSAEPVLDRDLAEFERRRVRRALDRLTPTQRTAIELAYFGGHTYREVAALLGEPEGTVKTRIRDGMIRLRDELGAPA